MICDLNGSLRSRQFLNVVNERTCFTSCALKRSSGFSSFFGLTLVKNRLSEVKVYGYLVTCMSTRACHLELVGDLLTDHFIMVLKRFTARRGRPQSIHSDMERTLSVQIISCENALN